MIDLFLLTQMQAVVERVNPDYPFDRDYDMQPLRRCAEFILKQAIKSGNVGMDGFIPVWELIYTTACSDPFYKDKSLGTVANHIQEFFQKAKHGQPGQLSNTKLQNKLAARLNKRQ